MAFPTSRFVLWAVLWSRVPHSSRDDKPLRDLCSVPIRFLLAVEICEEEDESDIMHCNGEYVSTEIPVLRQEAASNAQSNGATCVKGRYCWGFAANF